MPAEDGGIDLYIATQWLHVDQGQVAASLGLPLELTRLHLAGVGGAFGGREDLSMQVHVAMLALRTGRPVKMVYSREESFFGHVHRHPAWMTLRARRHPRRAPGLRAGPRRAGRRRLRVEQHRGGRRTPPPSPAGPTRSPTRRIDARVAYTNNPPCGAMRGFGAVQVAFAHESQMDRLAAALGMDPVDLRMRNALRTGDRLPTGQVVDGPAPVRELLEELRAMPLPPLARSTPMDLRELPGGVSNVTHGEGMTRGRRASRSGSRTSPSPRASTTTRPPACGWCRRRRAPWPRSRRPRPRWGRGSSP